jgi:hypothetical protein
MGDRNPGGYYRRSLEPWVAEYAERAEQRGMKER